MKLNIKKELHAKSINELSKQLKEAKKELAKLQLDQQMGKLKNTSELRTRRVEIAVMQTIIKKKMIEEKIMESVKVESKKEVSSEKPAITASNAAGAKAPRPRQTRLTQTRLVQKTQKKKLGGSVKSSERSEIAKGGKKKK